MPHPCFQCNGLVKLQNATLTTSFTIGTYTVFFVLFLCRKYLHFSFSTYAWTICRTPFQFFLHTDWRKRKCVCVCLCVCVWCVWCVWERGRERVCVFVCGTRCVREEERGCVYLCVVRVVGKRERTREIVCICVWYVVCEKEEEWENVCERGRERDRNRWNVMTHNKCTFSSFCKS